MTLVEALSQRINQLLKEQCITQYRLAMLSGVSQTSISDVRLMRNNTVSIHIIFDIAQGFGMDLQNFFDSPLFSYDSIID